MKSRVLLKNYFFISLYIISRIILNFVYTRLVILQYGSAINGYISSVLSIMGYLNVAEAGVGFATTYALYKPINEKDLDKCNSIMAFTNRYFRKIAFILTGAIMVISLVYPYLLSDFQNKYLGTYIIIVYGIVTLTEYFYDGKYKMLLDADQKQYIENGITTLSYIISYGVFIILCLLHKNFFIVSSSLLLGSLVRILCIFKIQKKYYPWINLKVKPDISIWKYSNDLFVQKLSSLAFSTTDILLISIFVGIKEVSVYSVFNMVLSGLTNCMSIITEAPEHIFGVLFAEDDLDKAKKNYYTYEHLCIIISTVFAACWFLLINSFISLYTANVHDINYINGTLSILMGIYFLLTYYRITAAIILNVTGKFDISKKIYMVEAIVNLVLSLILVFPLGILGVVLASVIAKTYSIYRIIGTAYEKILELSPIYFWRKITLNLFILSIFLFISKLGIISALSYVQFIEYGFISLLITSIITFSLNYLFFKNITKSVLDTIRYVLVRR